MRRRKNTVDDDVAEDLAAYRDLGRLAAESGAGVQSFVEVYPEAPPSAQFSESEALAAFASGFMERGAVENPGRLKSRFARCVAKVQAGGGSVDPRAVCAAAGRKKYGAAEMKRRAAAGRRRRSNPADEAAAASEAFHGRPVEEEIDVVETVHYHRNLAACGRLIELHILTADDKQIRLYGFDGAMLCFNESRDQLFIRGGDQYVDVEPFGLDVEGHEAETLGHVACVYYHTVKEHLGDEGGDADYYHYFGEETLLENWGVKDPERATPEQLRQVTPVLVYRFRNPSLEFVGGKYTVEDEGIRN